MTAITEQISIVYLDDELHNLSAFKAGFRRQHKIRVAETAQKAYELIDEELPHIIIADQRMPGVSGVEFFEKVKETHPTPTRVLLTAYSGSQTVIDAVNRGNIDKYLMKPWDPQGMESALKTAFAMFRAKSALKVKNEELRRINEELNRFVYSVSHDLRAPLMSVRGLIDLSQIEKDSEEVGNYLDMMRTSVDKMDEYIQTTLEYYRNYKTDIKPTLVDAKHLAEEVVNSMRNVHSELNLELIASGDCSVFTDRIRLKIALTNLVSNAVKYGRDSRLSPYTVQVDIKSSDTGVVIRVKDHGEGIAPDELKSIFNMFYKTVDNFDYRSTGLGLYLVKEAMVKIGGSVDVESELGKGSCFTLSVPNLPESQPISPNQADDPPV